MTMRSVISTRSAWPTPSGPARISRAEAVEAAIVRTEKVNPELNGLAYEAFDRARARAATPYGGFFDGVPTFVKDNTDVAGMPTMHGTDAWQPRPAAADGDFTKVFLSTGLIPLGKTRMPEFGFSASAEHPRHGPVRNPWDTDRTPGASSSGASVFVASGAVPIAHANDGGGSIRIPASCTGLVGLKPSRGRLPLERQMQQMPIRLGVNGVLTRTVRDTAAFYREMERAWCNPKLPAIGDVTGAGTARLRVAVFTRSVLRECAPEMRDLTLKTAALLEGLGHHVEHLDQPPVPKSFVNDFVAYWGLLAFAVVRSGRRELAPDFDRDRLDNLTLGLERHASRNLHRMPLAMARLATIAPRDEQALPDLRRGVDADAGRPAAAHRLPGPHRGLRTDHESPHRLGGVHAPAERHRRPRHLAAARGIRGRAYRSA